MLPLHILGISTSMYSGKMLLLRTKELYDSCTER